MTENTTMNVDASDEKATSRSTLLLAGGLAAALALGGGGYLLMSGGSDDLETGGAAAPTTSRVLPKAGTGTKKPTAKPSAASAKALPAKSTVRVGRDPFKALYVEPVAATGASTTTTSTSGSEGTATGTTPGTVTGTAYPLTLVRIASSGDSKLYTFDVDGERKTVLAAQRFGKYGELVVLAWVKSSTGKPTGAIIQVGDDEPLPVRVGEKLSVQ